MGGRGAKGGAGGGGGGGGFQLPPIGGTDGEKKKISQETWDKVAESIGKVEQEFGISNMVKRVVPQTLGLRTYANCQLATGVIGLNTTYFGDIDKLDKHYQQDVKTNWHPKGTTWESIVAHETGHALEKYVNDAWMNKNPVPQSQYWGAVFEYKGIKEIVKEATASAKKIIKADTGQTQRASAIRSGLSTYATKNHHETFAEAIADYVSNGNNANVLSKEIVRLAKEVLK